MGPFRLVLAGLVVCGCTDSSVDPPIDPPDPPALVGLWTNPESTGTDTLELSADGQFREQITSTIRDGTYRDDGGSLRFVVAGAPSDTPYVLDGDRLLMVALERAGGSPNSPVGAWHAEGTEGGVAIVLDLAIAEDGSARLETSVASQQFIETGTWTVEGEIVVTDLEGQFGDQSVTSWYPLGGALGKKRLVRQ